MGKKFLTKELMIFFAILALFLLILFSVIPFAASRTTTQATQVASGGGSGLKTTTLSIGGTVIPVEIADTPEEQALGLGKRPSLPQDQGLFFVFDAPSQVGIWMKDMQFPIDVLWIDANGAVIDIKENMTPDSYPEVFMPASPALYVLEVNAGFVHRHNISVGEKVTLAPASN